MPNFFTDNPDIEYNLNRLDLPSLAKLMEGDYSTCETFDTAPIDAPDAVENYLNICRIAGELCGGPVAKRSRQIDAEGNICIDGDVIYHDLVKKNLRDFRRAQLMGISIPHEYGGLNMPQVIKVAVLEMVSRADASLMNLVGLQDIAETIHEFGNATQKEDFIPPLARGEATGAMILTEPDSGSDLQSVRLKAIPPQDGDNRGLWHLQGVKRFITNGNGDILLVLARSEEGTTDGRGLSLFVCPKDKSIYIRRIEHKLGIVGSPTCDMVFNNTPAFLVGQRKRGLIKYVMSLMNGARIGVASQALGIAEAAYRTARSYAETRKQFGKRIVDFPPVYEMLTNMKLNIEAGRLLLYETAKVVDLYKASTQKIELAREENRDIDPEEKKQAKYYARLVSVLTPMVKYFNSELSNRVTYDGIQVMGGSGFMKDYNMERYYRDARITNIYEGTSQLQVVGAVGGILTGVLDVTWSEFANRSYPGRLNSLIREIKGMIKLLLSSVDYVKTKKDSKYTDFIARRLVDMSLDCFIGILFLDCAVDNTRKASMAEIWIRDAELNAERNHRFITSDRTQMMDLHKDIID